MSSDEVQTNHEAMRRLILSRFEDDALVREEVENWLDEAAAPGEWDPCDCAADELCYCFCKNCEKCDQEKEFGPGNDHEPGQGAVEVEIVPGLKILAAIAGGKSGKKKRRRGS